MALLNDDYIRNVIHRDAPWATSHGSDGHAYLGGGLLYYTLAYMYKTRVCVCLGSGGGFVPRLMRQAQRDLNLEGSRTILIDANIGLTASDEEYAQRRARLPGQPRRKWGLPRWIDATSFLRTEFPDIEILTGLTQDVVQSEGRQWRIDYLHIDADHSHQGRLRDFNDYAPLMSPNGIITFHDTDGTLPCSRALADIRTAGHHVVDMSDIGRGCALIRLKT